jgi:L-cysteine:1D-myo-inositol 2-amino-2-deoxy-alpha-D-glucopyranoside ligase
VAFSPGGGAAGTATELIGQMREALADDLDAPAALAAVDMWAETALNNTGVSNTDSASEADQALVRDAVNALLGVEL